MSLTAAGFGVHEAESGEGAIDLVRRVRPDCVLLDMHMPGMSGLDVCRVLRADVTTHDVTVVMLTADGKAAEKAEAFALEPDDYIVKPFAPRDLVSRITAAMRRRAEANEWERKRRVIPHDPMATGVSDHVRKIEEIVALLDA
jgi:DNA-binding response OmpR family regulator